MDRRFKHAERRLSREEALARIPDFDYLTIEQFQHAVGITNPLPIRKWVVQGRIAQHGRAGGGKFARTDVIRFVANRFSPYSKLEAKFFRTGVSLIASREGALSHDDAIRELHRLLDVLLDRLGPRDYERAVRARSTTLGYRFAAPRWRAREFETEFLRAGMALMPEERHESAAELADQLRAFSENG